MNNEVFGDVKFNSGWETQTTVLFRGKEVAITVSAEAYFEKDGITDAQKNSFSVFKSQKNEILNKVEQKIRELKDSNNFYPVMFVVKRNGDCGLVFDNISDVEDGIAVTIMPRLEIVSTDMYF